MIERSGERNSITIPVNLLVHKGEFVPFDAKSPFGAPKNDNAGVWAASPDGAATPKLLSQANDWGNENRCASFPQRRSRRIPADHRAEAAKQAHHRGRIGALELHLAAHRPAKLAGGAALPDSVPVFPQQPGLRKRGLKSLQSSATGKVLTGGEAGSSPALSAYRLTILAALLGARASSETFPPSATARNNGPMLISAVASHVWTASTGRRQSHAGWPPLALPGPSCCGGSVTSVIRGRDACHQLMAFPGADEVVAAKIEDDLSATHFARDVGIDVGRGVIGDLEREQLPRRLTIVLAELLKFVGDLPVIVWRHAWHFPLRGPHSGFGWRCAHRSILRKARRKFELGPHQWAVRSVEAKSGWQCLPGQPYACPGGFSAWVLSVT